MSERSSQKPTEFVVELLEPRQMLSGNGFEESSFVYDTNFDPNVGAVVTAFLDNDPQDSTDSYDILTGWKAAVDELVSVGIEEVTFAVFRNVNNGNLTGGPTIATVTSAVQYANASDLSVTILPLFEANGWRGDYDPSGSQRERFQSQYSEWIEELAGISGIDRFNIGSELNQMVENGNNASFFTSLINKVQNRFQQVGNSNGRIGYAANFDAYQNAEHVALLTQPGIDFMGVSAYRPLINSNQAYLVSGTGEVSSAALTEMVNNWNTELDRLESFASSHNLSLVIQEFGAVQQNYASVAPWSTSPGDRVDSGSPNRYAADTKEQSAVYESLLRALDNRRDRFESVTFWTWEHQASRGRRTFDQLGETGVIEKFAIWPTDDGGGERLVEFLDTRVGINPPASPTAETVLQVLAFGATGEESFDVIVDNIVIGTQNNVSTELTTYTFDLNTAATGDRVKIAFTNDLHLPSIGKDRNLYVDKIVVGDESFESESPTTFVSHFYNETSGLTSGYLQTELLNANGHFAYDVGFAQVESGPNSSQKDQFGNAVAIDGEFAIVGSRLEETGASDRNSGRAHLYQKVGDQWSFIKTLSADIPMSGDQFGYSVDISTEHAVVGAFNRDGSALNQGTVYVFNRNTGGLNNWGLIKEISNPFPVAHDQFGINVAILDDRIVVGTWLANDPSREGTNHGAAFVFEKNAQGVDQWGLAKILRSDDQLAAADKFGNSVAIANDLIAVGAKAEAGDNRGAVYLYKRDSSSNNWGQLAKIENPAPESGDLFGTNVALNDDYLIVGAPLDDGEGINSGSVYVYRRNNTGQWSLSQTLTPDQNLDSIDGRAFDLFGSSVGLSGDRLVVGASATNHRVGASGVVYEYVLDNGVWAFEKFFRPDSLAGGDRFGQAVAISDGETIFGTPLKNGPGASVDSGQAFFNTQYVVDSNPVVSATFRTVFPTQNNRPDDHQNIADSPSQSTLGNEDDSLVINFIEDESDDTDGPDLIELPITP